MKPLCIRPYKDDSYLYSSMRGIYIYILNQEKVYNYTS